MSPHAVAVRTVAETPTVSTSPLLLDLPRWSTTAGASRNPHRHHRGRGASRSQPRRGESGDRGRSTPRCSSGTSSVPERGEEPVPGQELEPAQEQAQDEGPVRERVPALARELGPEQGPVPAGGTG